MALELVKENKCFGGAVRRYRHASPATGTPMHFSVFIPPSALPPSAPPAPALIFLAGLTCTDANFTEKAGAARAAAAAGLALVAPDTSPRGEGVADDAAYDLGQGAGFYVDAARAPWAPHFAMATYVTRDLVDALRTVPGVDAGRLSISGHSMGGHGALTLGLAHPALFASVSAFAPICAASECPWGRKALTAYFGPRDDDGADALWASADASRVAAAYAGPPRHVMVDVGTGDEFLGAGQLLPEALEAAVAANAAGSLTLDLRRRDGYDHSYFFIASFVDDHVAHAARAHGLVG